MDKDDAGREPDEDRTAEWRQITANVQKHAQKHYEAEDKEARAHMTAQHAPQTLHIGEYIMAINPSDPFYRVLGEIAELHARKSTDYGTDSDPFANVRASEEFNIAAWVGAALRANDKMTRIKSMVSKGYLANESVRDSLTDIAVYMIIATCLLDEAPTYDAPAN